MGLTWGRWASRPTAMGRDLLGQAVDSLGIALRGFGDDGPAGAVCGDRDIVMPSGFGCLIDGQALHSGEILLGHGEIDVALAQAHDAVETHSRQARHRPKGHLPAEREDQRLEEDGA